jgi:hypothetical protein
VWGGRLRVQKGSNAGRWSSREPGRPVPARCQRCGYVIPSGSTHNSVAGGWACPSCAAWLGRVGTPTPTVLRLSGPCGTAGLREENREVARPVGGVGGATGDRTEAPLEGAAIASAGAVGLDVRSAGPMVAAGAAVTPQAPRLSLDHGVHAAGAGSTRSGNRCAPQRHLPDGAQCGAP